MPTLHHLFFSQDTNKRTLHRNIAPTPRQQEMQQERWHDVCDYLIEDLQERTGITISSWLQGSYKLGTQIRPTKKSQGFDIDLGIYFHLENNPLTEEGTISPKIIKDLVQESLLRYKQEAEDEVLEVLIPPKERCSRIRFTQRFHIDTPAYYLNKDTTDCLLATETKGWENSNPRDFYDWFCNLFSDQENSQVRRLIRYFKIWSQLNMEVPPTSILLTVLVAEAFESLTDEEKSSDDIALGRIAVLIQERLLANSTVKNPVNPEEPINRFSEDETRAFIMKLEQLSQKAEKAVASQRELDALAVWSSLFFHFFPFPEPSEDNPSRRALVPVKVDPQVVIRAVSIKNPNVSVQGLNQIGPIPKNCAITFRIANTNDIHPDWKVQWIVRNEGEEADFESDLGHNAGNGYSSTEEFSAFKGVHYMDVTISSPEGLVMGFRRIPVEISGNFVPPRNQKKPGWVKLRSRKH